jgi:IMP dehydrogenase
MKDLKLALTYDDVLLKPQKSSIKSRKDVSLKTNLTKNITLNIPLISANMDTVTESAMAIQMARKGGIGIIHRFMTIQEQVNEVFKVKRAESIFVDNPYTLTKEKTVLDAKEFMKTKGISGILIVDPKGKLEGICTSRDIIFERELKKPISEIMTKNSNLITAKFGISPGEAREILHKNRIEKLPIIDENGFLTGLITSSDIKKIERHPYACKDKKGRLRVGAAIGVKDDFLERTEALIRANCDVIVIDIAHGHSDLAINTVKSIKKRYDVNVIGGNIATERGAKDLIEAGCDAVKIGIGPGSICTTRMVTGCGVPQLYAILDVSKIANKKGIPAIADGGIRGSNDIVKALAAGASSVMMGSIIAGTEESPGITLTREDGKYKVIRGMASFGAAIGRESRENNKDVSKDKEFEDITPEGVEALVRYKGNVSEVLNKLIGGLRSGLSYNGAHNLQELQKNAEFIRITNSSLLENKPHDVKKY